MQSGYHVPRVVCLNSHLCNVEINSRIPVYHPVDDIIRDMSFYVRFEI